MSRLIAVLLVLCVSQSALAEDPQFVHVKAGRLVPDDGNSVDVGEGCYMRGDVCLGVAKEVARLEEENKTLNEQLVVISNDPPASLKAIVVSAIVGLAVGGLSVYMISHR